MRPFLIAFGIALALFLALLATGAAVLSLPLALALAAAIWLGIVGLMSNRPGAVGSIATQYREAKPPGAMLGAVLQRWNGPLNSWGYKVQSQSAGGITFVRRYRPWWVWLLTILTLPIGLLFLLITRTDHLTWSFVPDGDGTLATVAGDAPRKVRAAFGHHETPT